MQDRSMLNAINMTKNTKTSTPIRGNLAIRILDSSDVFRFVCARYFIYLLNCMHYSATFCCIAIEFLVFGEAEL